MDPSGLACFGRDQRLARQVWSRALGYPGDPAYRDFYRDLGFDLPASELAGLGAGTMTGLKYHRITGPGATKLPYDPALANARVEQHAEHFVRSCARRLASVPPGEAPPVLVAAYDAELFGHWWFEGPAFIEQVLRRLAHERELAATSLSGYLRAHPRLIVVRPAASSWGEGGYGQVWVGPRTAPLWRLVHRSQQAVSDALTAHRSAPGPRATALDLAIRELLLLQASDWPFMIQQGDVAAYAVDRVRQHAARVRELLAVTVGGDASDEAQRLLTALQRPGCFLGELSRHELRSAFDP
jgi:1,4-alpha-glucan branching enzyme